MRKARLEYGITHIEEDEDEFTELLREGRVKKGESLDEKDIKEMTGNKDVNEIHGGNHNTTLPEQLKTLAAIAVIVIIIVLLYILLR